MSKPFFSIIIPVKGRFRKKKFPLICEVIYVNKFKKAKARNWGSKKAKAKYLIHIDIDNEISDEIFNKAKTLIQKTGAKLIVLEEFIASKDARALERKILSGNKLLATPQIIEKKLFDKVGGYDERFDELDDWALWMRLKRTPDVKTVRIPNATAVYEPTNMFEIIKRRFKKGRELKYFKEVYGSVPQTNIKNILKLYLRNRPSISLLILKFFDITALFVGSVFPVRPNIDKLYEEKAVAKDFNKEQDSLYGRIKNFLEVKSIFYLLATSGSVLDLGAGTGRITKELVKKKYKVTACDTSAAMLSQFSKNLPKPTLLKSDKLPFKGSSFDSVISMRVIWHIKDSKRREKFFSEAVRVAKKSIIMDFSFFGSPSDHQFNWIEVKSLTKKHNIKIVSYFYLPLGRLLIKFEKN